MMDIKAQIRAAKRRTATEDICLRGDLAGQYEELLAELEALPKNDKLGGDPQRQRILAELERIRLEMQDGTVQFKMLALPPSQFQALIDAHPPRRVGDDLDELDLRYGFDRSAVFPTLVRATVVEPELDEDDWQFLLTEGLSPGQMSQLRLAVMKVNGERVDVPFSLAASNGSRTSER